MSEIRWRRVLGVCVLLGLMLEGVARIAIRRSMGHPFESFDPYLWSAYGLVRNNPRLTSTAFQINNAGFRATHSSQQKKAPRTLRVVVLGGSVAYSGLGRVVHPKYGRVGSDETIAPFLETLLREDPELEGIQVEVLNAAVNFNRIPEVTTGYLDEWRFWDPDLLLVMGSANNFSYAPVKGTVYARKWGFQTPHPWFLEFDRQANSTSLTAFSERIVRSVGQHSAAVALLRKGIPSIIDGSSAWSEAHSFRRAAAAPGLPDVASFDEYDRYVDEYLGYADAIVAAANMSNQKVAFFWEYYIAFLDGIRTFNEEEQWLYERNRGYSRLPEDKIYDFHARDRVREHVEKEGASFVDPMDVLRTDTSTIFIDYLHYTGNGNRVMAGAVYRTMKSWFHERAGQIRSQSTPLADTNR
jgi:hypothetical protein